MHSTSGPSASIGTTLIRAAQRFSVFFLLGAVITGTVPGLRHATLRAVGRALATTDPLQAADIVVISVDADGAGVLEASDLVHGGYSKRVAVFADPPDATDAEFVRRGVPYFDAAEVATQELRALGVVDTVRIPRPVSGTEDEAVALLDWCDRLGLKTVVFVSTTDHARRTRRVLARAFAGHATRIIVRGSAYSEFSPEAWWTTRTGARIGLIELQKLLLDVLRHPATP